MKLDFLVNFLMFYNNIIMDKCCIEQKQQIQILNDKINNLYLKLEVKCEEVELLNNEISKQKDNYKKLDFERKANINNYEIKINKLNEIIKEQEIKYNNLIIEHNKEIAKIKYDYESTFLKDTEELNKKILKLQKKINKMTN